jgi:hypothetical protein
MNLYIQKLKLILTLKTQHKNKNHKLKIMIVNLIIPIKNTKVII